MAAVDWCYDLPAWASAGWPATSRQRRFASFDGGEPIGPFAQGRSMPKCTSRNDLGICPNRTAINTVRGLTCPPAEGPAASVSAHLCYQGGPCTTSETWARARTVRAPVMDTGRSSEELAKPHSAAAARLLCGRRISWTMTSWCKSRRWRWCPCRGPAVPHADRPPSLRDAAVRRHGHHRCRPRVSDHVADRGRAQQHPCHQFLQPTRAEVHRIRLSDWHVSQRRSALRRTAATEAAVLDAYLHWYAAEHASDRGPRHYLAPW